MQHIPLPNVTGVFGYECAPFNALIVLNGTSRQPVFLQEAMNR